MNGSDENNSMAEQPGQARSVSRRKVVVAGALMAPVLLTMRVPTAGARVATSPTASCRPAGSAQPDEAVCDGKPDEEPGQGLVGPDRRVGGPAAWDSSYDRKSREDYRKHNLGW